MKPIFFKEGVEDFETGKNFVFIFHGVDRKGFRAVVDESNKVFIALAGCDLLGAYIRVNGLPWVLSLIGGMQLEGAASHLGLNADRELLNVDFVH